jgi:hypothetical protein
MVDFNLDVLKYQSCNLSRTYIDLLFSLGLLQVITKPTRCKPNSATLIDHVCTNHRYITSRSNMSISADVHPWGAISLLTAPPPTTGGVKSH